jgi:hypothetical protein
MFIAQVDEVDAYDQSGEQKEDVNSLVQYLANVFQIRHSPLNDSDDDNARYFHASKFEEYKCFQPEVVSEEYDVEFPLYLEMLKNSMSPDIAGPPPKRIFRR